jgi:hypothetical protein
VDCGPDWDEATCQAAVNQRLHPLAMTPKSIALFYEDIEYQVNAGFYKVLTWDEVKKIRPKNLKISPVAVVPQVGIRGQIILDLSFPVYEDINGVRTIIQDSVNDTTVITVPTTPVREIGKVLHQLLYYMKTALAGLWI